MFVSDTLSAFDYIAHVKKRCKFNPLLHTL